MRPRLIPVAFAIAVATGSAFVGAAGRRQATPGDSHITWVADALKRMQTIKPGMTRKELLVVFRTEGGLSTGLHRTFVSTDCGYFKVDVDFEAVGRPGYDQNGRVTLVEDERDRILKISRPYLEFSIID